MAPLRPFHLVPLLLLSASRCRSSPDPLHDPPRPAAPEAQAKPTPPRPVEVATLAVPGDLDAFVVRATGAGRRQMVFVPGMCVHPGGYVAAFQGAAAARGDLVAVQGDVACGGDGAARRWSGDLGAMNRRIEKAFEVAGLGPVKDAIVIGYSQGAERAEQLVAHHGARYAAAILLGTPVVPSASKLRSARAVALLAGSRDAFALTRQREGAAALRAAKIPTMLATLPGAQHGQMGEAPEERMAEALDFAMQEAPRPEGGHAGGRPTTNPP